MTPDPGRADSSQTLRDPAAEALVASVVEVAGEGLLGVLLFGSRLAGTAPGRHSAYDLVVLVEEYRAFYGRLVESGHHRRSPVLLSALARILPPNVLSFDPGLPGGELAKMMVLTLPDLERALSARTRDHFLKGRLVQRVSVLHAGSAELRRHLEQLLRQARRDVLRWAGPWLDETFGPEELARRMLEVSYRGEIRPEAAGRVASVFQAQRSFLVRAYREALEEAEREGSVERVAEKWRLVRRPGSVDRLRWRLYFAVSKARATSRWLKHVATFDDWLTYLQRKVERRTGMVVELTPLERRLPLLLLWPKVVRVLLSLRRAGSGESGS